MKELIKLVWPLAVSTVFAVCIIFMLITAHYCQVICGDELWIEVMSCGLRWLSLQGFV